MEFFKQQQQLTVQQNILLYEIMLTVMLHMSPIIKSIFKMIFFEKLYRV